MGTGMKVLIISGFLGSGKTTLILSAVERLSSLGGRKVAVLVNDFGSVGIDGKVMQKFGLQVKEIQSGCICCTLGADLLSSLKTVAEKFKPELIVIEPSGVADPGAVKGLLASERNTPIHFLKTLVLVDAVRHESISRALGPLVRKQLEAADLIIINKVDQVEETAARAVEDGIRQMGIQTPVVLASARTGFHFDQIMQGLDV